MAFMQAKSTFTLNKIATVKSLKDTGGETKVKSIATIGAASTENEATQDITAEEKHKKKVDDLKKQYEKCKKFSRLHFFLPVKRKL